MTILGPDDQLRRTDGYQPKTLEEVVDRIMEKLIKLHPETTPDNETNENDGEVG